MNSAACRLLCVDYGGTRTKMAVFDFGSDKWEPPFIFPSSTNVGIMFEQMAGRFRGEACQTWSLGLPGTTQHNLRFWRNARLGVELSRNELKEIFSSNGLPDPVIVTSDLTAAAIQVSEGNDDDNALVVQLSTGFGSRLVLGGKAWLSKAGVSPPVDRNASRVHAEGDRSLPFSDWFDFDQLQERVAPEFQSSDYRALSQSNDPGVLATVRAFVEYAELERIAFSPRYTGPVTLTGGGSLALRAMIEQTLQLRGISSDQYRWAPEADMISLEGLQILSSRKLGSHY